MELEDWLMLVDVAEELGLDWRSCAPDEPEGRRKPRLVDCSREEPLSPAGVLLRQAWRSVVGERRLPQGPSSWPSWTPHDVDLGMCAWRFRHEGQLYLFGLLTPVVLVAAAQVRPGRVTALDAAAATLLASGRVLVRRPPRRGS